MAYHTGVCMGSNLRRDDAFLCKIYTPHDFYLKLPRIREQWIPSPCGVWPRNPLERGRVVFLARPPERIRLARLERREGEGACLCERLDGS